VRFSAPGEQALLDVLDLLAYALESGHRAFVGVFAVACAASSVYGFLSGAWPFGIVELIWSGIAVRRSREPI